MSCIKRLAMPPLVREISKKVLFSVRRTIVNSAGSLKERVTNGSPHNGAIKAK